MELFFRDLGFGVPPAACLGVLRFWCGAKGFGFMASGLGLRFWCLGLRNVFKMLRTRSRAADWPYSSCWSKVASLTFDQKVVSFPGDSSTGRAAERHGGLITCGRAAENRLLRPLSDRLAF